MPLRTALHNRNFAPCTEATGTTVEIFPATEIFERAVPEPVDFEFRAKSFVEIFSTRDQLGQLLPIFLAPEKFFLSAAGKA